MEILGGLIILILSQWFSLGRRVSRLEFKVDRLLSVHNQNDIVGKKNCNKSGK